MGIVSWRAARLIAGAVSVSTGLRVIVTALLTPHLQHRVVSISAGAGAVAMGVVVVPFLPWRRWPYRCVIAVVLVGFTLNAIDRSFAPTRGIFGATVMTVFIGTGFVSTRRQMAVLTVPMLVAIAIPFFANADSGVSWGSVLFIAGGSVTCGQCTAWFAERLAQSELLAAHRLAVLEATVEAGLMLSGSEDLRVANTVVTVARRLLGVDRVALLVRSDDELVFTAQSGWAAFPQDTRVNVFDATQVRGAIPISGPHGPVALLVVPEGTRVDLDSDLLSTLVTQIGSAITHEASLSVLRDAALLDPLTGVGNRRRRAKNAGRDRTELAFTR